METLVNRYFPFYTKNFCAIWKAMLLRRWREKNGFTLAELSEAWSVPITSLSNWETGRNSPRLTDLARIEELTDGQVNLRDFLKEAFAKDKE